MKMQQAIKEGFDSVRESLAEGWERLRQSTAGALTRFKPSERSNPPAHTEIDDSNWLPGPRWALMGGDVFEDDDRLIVRLEVPGMERSDFDIEVRDQRLIVRGEKRFEREQSNGRWRTLQCAYGRFQRSVPLPKSIVVDDANATYRRGVLRIELPKARDVQPQRRIVPVVG
ncbi:Hsp20/alpha crystallin family protein [Piscinibacter sakaiensis]|uniref:Hsp20/alpha crystallin family protein n=1 Tax=Piscinibacter sakaiensis TaxID=1547922 RepID=UPI003AAABF3D